MIFSEFLSFLCSVLRVSPDTDPSRRDRSVSVPAESAAETATVNHVWRRCHFSMAWWWHCLRRSLNLSRYFQKGSLSNRAQIESRAWASPTVDPTQLLLCTCEEESKGLKTLLIFMIFKWAPHQPATPIAWAQDFWNLQPTNSSLLDAWAPKPKT